MTPGQNIIRVKILSDTGATKHNSANQSYQSCLCLFDHSTATVVSQIGGVLPMFSVVIFVLFVRVVKISNVNISNTLTFFVEKM